MKVISIIVLLSFFFSTTAAPALAAMTYLYDANGNMTSDGIQCREYNESNQLKKVKRCSDNKTIAEYVYDHTGKRIIKREYENGTLKRTVYSPTDEYETVVLASSGATQNTTYYKANDEVVAKKNPDGTINYYHNDHLGSNSVLTDQSGNVVERTTYEPYGEVKSGGTKSKFGYTGQEKDNETGLNYYDARYYDPHIQRFVQPDTLLPDVYDPQQLNRYSYARNNPVKYTDPSGHFAFLAIPLAYWVVGAAVTAFSAYLATPQGQKTTKAAITTVATGVSQMASNIGKTISTVLNKPTASNDPGKTISTTNTNKGGPSGGGSQNPKIGPLSRIAPIIPMVNEAKRNIDGGKTTASVLLKNAESWLGEGYREIHNGVYRSADNLRQFRMKMGDLLDKKIGPHASMESIGEDGRKILENSHIKIIDP